MNKKELIEEIANATGLSRNKAEQVINTFMQTTLNILEDGGYLKLIGFGSFSVVDRAARKGRNPKTGQEIAIPARRLPQFRPGNKLRHAVMS